MRRIFGTVTLLLVLAGMTFADARPTSTPEERKRALDVIERLEADPMSPALEQDRRWINDWVFATQDVHVVLCTSVIKPLLAEKNSDPRKALMLQNLLAMAAFQLNSPDKASDSVQTQMAGAEGMLRAYGNISRKMPGYKSQFMESLLAKQQSGTLEAYVREGTAECRAHGNGTMMKP